MNTLTQQEHERVGHLLRQFESFGSGIRGGWITQALGYRQAWVRRGRLLIGSAQVGQLRPYLLVVLDKAAARVTPAENDQYRGLTTWPEIEGGCTWIVLEQDPGPWFAELRAVLPQMEAELAAAIADAAFVRTQEEAMSAQMRAARLKRLAQAFDQAAVS